MAKIDLKFLDYLYDDTFISVRSEVTEYFDAKKEETINTNVLRINLNSESLKDEGFIDLDISTAIKFAKTLRTEINKAKEVQNG